MIHTCNNLVCRHCTLLKRVPQFREQLQHDKRIWSWASKLTIKQTYGWPGPPSPNPKVLDIVPKYVRAKSKVSRHWSQSEVPRVAGWSLGYDCWPVEPRWISTVGVGSWFYYRKNPSSAAALVECTMLCVLGIKFPFSHVASFFQILFFSFLYWTFCGSSRWCFLLTSRSESCWSRYWPQYVK